MKGGTLLVDDIQILGSGTNDGVLDYLLREMDILKGKILFVLVGKPDNHDHRVGLRAMSSNFAKVLDLKNYDEEEVSSISKLLLKSVPKADIKESEVINVSCRVLSQRVCRARGLKTFGNVHAIKKLVALADQRRLNRLEAESATGKESSEQGFTIADVIGVSPEDSLSRCEEWSKLLGLVGLRAAKKSAESFFQNFQTCYESELANQLPDSFSVNQLFLGSSGVGRKTFATYYGRVLKALGLLSVGEVTFIKATILLRDSPANLANRLTSCDGGVIVVLDAHELDVGDTEGPDNAKKVAVVDAIVAGAHGVPWNDRCVILFGETRKMKIMLERNRPLARRFPIASAFVFDDFSRDELGDLFERRANENDPPYLVTADARRKAAFELRRESNRIGFKNVHDIDNLLKAAIERHLAAAQELSELDQAGVPVVFLFSGPKGSGKTLVAKMIEHIFVGLGLLAEATLRTEDTIALSQTQSLTQILEESTGRVLLLKNAHHLAGDAQGPLHELRDYLSREANRKRQIVILDSESETALERLAGLLFLQDQGTVLATMHFRKFTGDECVEVLVKMLNKQRTRLKKLQLDVSALEMGADKEADGGRAAADQARGQSKRAELALAFAELASCPDWENGHDVKRVAQKAYWQAISAAKAGDFRSAIISADVALDFVRGMTNERRKAGVRVDDA
ncbi:hypothetical protein HK405_002717 [Cladochytrium tenue]|nr:hypothetical protein HK405_002717 [Cladochytrium tenue]